MIESLEENIEVFPDVKSNNHIAKPWLSYNRRTKSGSFYTKLVSIEYKSVQFHFMIA